MASAYVPPPPEEDFVGFSTQQNDCLSQAAKPYSNLQFGGEGFLGSVIPSSRPRYLSHSRHPTSNSDERMEIHPRQVPVTPAHSQLSRVPATADHRLNFSYEAADEPGGRGNIALRSVNEIPELYRSVFKNYSYFNLVQSKVFEDVMYTDKPLVTSAPTGSGKTVIFELAIIRLLIQLGGQLASAKIIYVAPIKALCTERFEDWQAKFGPLGLKCCELTGDSQLDDYFELQNAQIVMTTPEKWDSMTRKWRDHKSLVQLVRLFLIDEVHQLNDETRGPTMEAIVSRMKTIRSSLHWESQGSELRFLAVSATMPNISDVAAWLGSSEGVPALEYAIDDSFRPVRLRKVVLGYPDASTEFKFDLSLNYRLSGVIQCYSDQKPTLVFCATRKGTQQAASTLIKDARFVMNSQHKQRLVSMANSLKDGKLRELVMYGVGYHHAGMDVSDRKSVEALFTAGELPVLFATSTLAMGVNLPAHLVVIKSTMHYLSGMFQECSESQVLQMIGRAGRPQFDTTATAVIMTRNSTKMKYEALLSGTQLIESSLHHHLIEHLNAEIVLNTVTDVSVALEWLRSTFFYTRVKQNPKHYGLPQEEEQKEEQLQQLCLKHLHVLEEAGLIKMEDGFTLQPTETGRLMARYYIAFESMKRFLGFTGKEDLGALVTELSRCREFADVRLRMNERKILNTLNKDKNKSTIRFPISGKIKTTDMKVNCLIQANLGCLPVQEFGLNQDTQKILRAASRLSKCLMELEMLSDNFESLLSAVLLSKCLQARLWDNSKHVSRQLDKIGFTLSTALVNAGLTSFEKIKQKTPRELELIMNRHPPFGNQVLEAISRLPAYSLTVEQSPPTQASQTELTIGVRLDNHELLKQTSSSQQHTVLLLVGDMENRVLCKQRLRNSQLMSNGQFRRNLSVQRCSRGDDLRIHLVCMDLVGLDIEEVYIPRYSRPLIGRPPPTAAAQTGGCGVATVAAETKSRGTVRSVGSDGGHRKACSHRCINKAVCGHECCKTGVSIKSRPPSAVGGSVRQDKPTTTSRVKHSTSNYTPQTRQPSTASLSSSTRRGPTPTKPQSSLGSYSSDHYSTLDQSTSYSGAYSPLSESTGPSHSTQRDDCAYQDYCADLELSDLDNCLTDDGDNPSNSVDMSEWFDPDIAYFTTSEHSVANHTPNKESKQSNKKCGSFTSELSTSEYTPSRKSNGGGKKQSVVSQMREMSQRLEQEQSGTRPVIRKTFERLPKNPDFSGRKRLIDSMFDRLLEPAKSHPKKLPLKSDVPSATSKAQVIATNPHPAKKLKLREEYDSKAASRTGDSGSTHFSLSKKLSSQLHSHTEACRPSPPSNSCDIKTNTVISSLYDNEPTAITQPKPVKPVAPALFFTAGPVSNELEEEEEGDLFSSVFAGIF